MITVTKRSTDLKTVFISTVNSCRTLPACVVCVCLAVFIILYIHKWYHRPPSQFPFPAAAPTLQSPPPPPPMLALIPRGGGYTLMFCAHVCIKPAGKVAINALREEINGLKFWLTINE